MAPCSALFCGSPPTPTTLSRQKCIDDIRAYVARVDSAMAACRSTPAAFLTELASELAAQPLLPAEVATVGERARRSSSALASGSNAGKFLVLYALQGMRSVTTSTVNLPACFFAVDEAGTVVVVSARLNRGSRGPQASRFFFSPDAKPPSPI